MLLRCSVDGELQPCRQQVFVSRPEDGGGRLVLMVVEPMLSLIKRHTLASCTLDRSSNELLMELVKVKEDPAGSSPPKAGPSTPTAAAPGMASASAPASACAPATAGAAPPHVVWLLSSSSDDEDDDLPKAGSGSLLDQLDGDGPAGSLTVTPKRLADLFEGDRVELPLSLLLHCRIEGVLQPVQKAIFRASGQRGKLYCKEPLLSVMKGRQKLSTFAPASHNGLPALTLDLATSGPVTVRPPRRRCRASA
ncbi:hypothetical protein FOA52_006074 [Chlamydomonas sp. UWO 241]|nr:hypothetical protein FOA52_006074 [Chlamydomonas sp. UWO 241]